MMCSKREYSDRMRSGDYVVRPVSMRTARRLVTVHHYAKGGSNTATYLHGLFPVGSVWECDCVGIAWWIPPTKSAAIASFCDWMGVLSLSRMVVVPGVPKNACSFLLAKSMKLIDRARWPCLVTYADKWRGHTGSIYKATNWEYVGCTSPQPVFVRRGRMLARKAGGKTRTHSEMFSLGAELVGYFPKEKFRHIDKKFHATV